MMTAKLKTMRRGALAALVALLVSCGGIESPNGDAGGGPAPTLLALGGGGTATAGAGAVPLSATHTGSGTVAWQLSPGSPGSLSASSGDSVSYLPPPAGAVTSPATVTITATVDGVSKSTTVTLNPASPGVYLLAGTTNATGNLDGTGSAARFSLLYYGNVAVDASGNVFTVDWYTPTVRKTTPQGVVTTYASRGLGSTESVDGPVASATFRSTHAIAVDGAGNVYVADSPLIRKITPTGIVSTVASLVSAQIRGLAAGPDGTLYAAASSAVFSVAPGGAVTRIAGGSSGIFASGPASFNNLRGIAIDASGNLIVADTGNHSVRQVTPGGTVTTIAGSATQAGNTDGPATSATFQAPSGVAVDAAGRILVSDTTTRTVRVITRSNGGATVATLAGHYPSAVRGTGVAVDGSAGVAEFAMPSGLAVNASGEVLVGDASAIRKIGTNGAVSTLAGVPFSLNAVDGTGTGAGLEWSFYAGGLWSDAGGTIYMADSVSDTVRRVTPAGVVTTIAGALYTPGNADGAAAAARFSHPRGITGDANGNLYVADSGTIRKIAADGTVSTLAGSAGVSGTADGAGSAARFTAPEGMVVDAAGNLFVIDRQSGRITIRRITPAGVVTTFARSNADYAENLAIDASGNLYLAGYSQAVVYKIAPDGSETVLAGAADQHGTADGTGGNARFTAIGGVTIDPAGNVYAMDTGAGTIRKITPAGVVTTVAGTPGLFGPNSASAALPGVLPAAWAIRWVGPKTLAVMGENGLFKVILP